MSRRLSGSASSRAASRPDPMRPGTPARPRSDPPREPSGEPWSAPSSLVDHRQLPSCSGAPTCGVPEPARNRVDPPSASVARRRRRVHAAGPAARAGRAAFGRSRRQPPPPRRAAASRSPQEGPAPAARPMDRTGTGHARPGHADPGRSGPRRSTALPLLVHAAPAQPFHFTICALVGAGRDRSCRKSRAESAGTSSSRATASTTSGADWDGSGLPSTLLERRRCGPARDGLGALARQEHRRLHDGQAVR